MVTTAPVTIEQAAASLGVSASTIRRRIRAGALQVTETHRPQGTVWLVHLPPGVTPAAEAATVDTAPVDTTPTAQPTPTLAQADALASLIQATLTPIIAPLVGELAASRQVNERLTDRLMSQAGTIADLREERGRQSAELERAMKAERVLTERDLPNPNAGRLGAMFVVPEAGRLAVFVNTRLIDEPTVVAWAERKASAGELVGIWFEGD